MVTYPQVHRVLDLANSELESADSSSDSNAEAAKVGVWVWASMVSIEGTTTGNYSQQDATLEMFHLHDY